MPAIPRDELFSFKEKHGLTVDQMAEVFGVGR